MKIRWFLGCLLLLLVIPGLACADVSYEGRTYPEDAEYKKRTGCVAAGIIVFRTSQCHASPDEANRTSTV